MLDRTDRNSGRTWYWKLGKERGRQKTWFQRLDEVEGKTGSHESDTGRHGAGKSDPENRVEKSLLSLFFLFLPLIFSPLNFPYSYGISLFNSPFLRFPYFFFSQDSLLVLPNSLYAYMRKRFLNPLNISLSLLKWVSLACPGIFSWFHLRRFLYP